MQWETMLKNCGVFSPLLVVDHITVPIFLFLVSKWDPDSRNYNNIYLRISKRDPNARNYNNIYLGISRATLILGTITIFI